jgi:hypothetical protein
VVRRSCPACAELRLASNVLGHCQLTPGRSFSVDLQKPKSAYFHYMDDVRPQVTKDNPDKKITERSQIMAAMWNKIKETKEAEKYLKRAAEDKARYEKEKAAYEAK